MKSSSNDKFVKMVGEDVEMTESAVRKIEVESKKDEEKEAE